jgi:threo-3-hydroxy-L-aspartate ammonia-lyase
MLELLTIDLIREAAARIRPYVLRTPLIPFEVDRTTTLYLKPELLQSIGAFKIRGAFSLMTTLPKDCPGVVAHSSGNHAQAVARAARVLGLKAVIVMPSDAPEVKRARTEADGAEIITVGPDSDERARVAAEVARSRGLVLVPPYDHPLIAAGQGTLAIEIMEDAHAMGVEIDRFYCPVSGGGLMAGCAVAVHAYSPSTEIVAVEPEDGNDTKLSLEKGERTKIAPPRTIADGLRVRIPGERTFPVLKAHLSRVALVRDAELEDAMRFALDALRLVVEPSGAASLAVALREVEEKKSAKNESFAVVLSGGNVEPGLLAQVATPGIPWTKRREV